MSLIPISYNTPLIAIPLASRHSDSHASAIIDELVEQRRDHTFNQLKPAIHPEALVKDRDQRSRLLNEIVPAVLDFARKHQNGRGTGDVPTGTFTEGWFRTSGLGASVSAILYQKTELCWYCWCMQSKSRAWLD